jgi:cytochrome oxidase Cu insertion factor (SCO1/SenC/PrrC family)
MVLFSLFLGAFSIYAVESKPVLAPPFSLVDVSDKVIHLSDFKGKNVILVFYVGHG